MMTVLLLLSAANVLGWTRSGGLSANIASRSTCRTSQVAGAKSLLLAVWSQW
jgi:hypothetical protein